MKRKFAVLAVLGALVALALPASSMAGSVSPASSQFEIAGGGGGFSPRFYTSLGSCTLAKITGQFPKAPENQVAGPVIFNIPTPTVGSCSSGASMTLTGQWQVTAGGYNFSIFSAGNNEAVILRFSSLPGCKLNVGPKFNGNWSNGVTTPSLLKSGFSAHSAIFPGTWANDGGTCAPAGEKETVLFLTGEKSATSETHGVTPVNNLTSPTTPLIVGN